MKLQPFDMLRLVGLWALIACADAPPAALPAPAEVAMDAELVLFWGGLQSRASDLAFERSLAYARSHPEILPDVVRRLHGDGAESKKAARILGELKRPEDVAALQQAIAQPVAGDAAADALGNYRTSEAKSALVQSIAATETKVAICAIEAVRIRKWPEACEALRAGTRAEDDNRRFHAARAAMEGECLSAAEILALASDPLPEIASLAQSFGNAPPGR